MRAPDALSRNPFELEVDLIDLPLEIRVEWYNNLHRQVQENPDNYQQFALYDEMLFKLISVGSSEPLRWVQCLPVTCRVKALEESHDSPTSGHCGTFKTFERVRKNYYWPKMREEVKSYVQSCPICQAQKVDHRLAPGLMGSTPKVTRPFELLCSDLIGPLPRSTKRNTCLLVCVDVFSKYVYLQPLRDAKAKKVVEFVEKDIYFDARVSLSCPGGQR